jgi:hypothetical protein
MSLGQHGGVITLGATNSKSMRLKEQPCCFSLRSKTSRLADSLPATRKSGNESSFSHLLLPNRHFRGNGMCFQHITDEVLAITQQLLKSYPLLHIKQSELSLLWLRRNESQSYIPLQLRNRRLNDMLRFESPSAFDIAEMLCKFIISPCFTSKSWMNNVSEFSSSFWMVQSWTV